MPHANDATGLTEKANGAQVTLQGDASLVASSTDVTDVDWSIGGPSFGWVVGEVKV